MEVNPYESPQTVQSAADEQESHAQHRSFRLTSNQKNQLSTGIPNRIERAIGFSVMYQLLALLSSAMLLDGGAVFVRGAIAAGIYWLVALVVTVCFRPNTARLARASILRWAFLAILAVFLLSGL